MQAIYIHFDSDMPEIERTLIKFGDSLALTVPDRIVETFSLRKGDRAKVGYEVDGNRLRLIYTFEGAVGSVWRLVQIE